MGKSQFLPFLPTCMTTRGGKNEETHIKESQRDSLCLWCAGYEMFSKTSDALLADNHVSCLVLSATHTRQQNSSITLTHFAAAIHHSLLFVYLISKILTTWASCVPERLWCLECLLFYKPTSPTMKDTAVTAWVTIHAHTECYLSSIYFVYLIGGGIT